LIVVRIEMWPGGREEAKRELQLMTIANVGGTPTSGDYRVRVPKSAEYSKRPGTATSGSTWRTALVRAFPRRKLGPVDLVLRALVALVADRNAATLANYAGETFGDEPMECL
jgi:hypothetical protein